MSLCLCKAAVALTVSRSNVPISITSADKTISNVTRAASDAFSNRDKAMRSGVAPSP